MSAALDDTNARLAVVERISTSLTGLTGNNGRVGNLEKQTADHEVRLRSLETAAVKVITGAIVGSTIGGGFVALVIQLLTK